MINEMIGPRRADWQDWMFDPRLRERSGRQWHRTIGYGRSWPGLYEGYSSGAATFMSSTMREEFIKCFEQYCHMTSGLGESMQHEIVSRYYRQHPERRPGNYQAELPHVSRWSDASAVPKHRLPR